MCKNIILTGFMGAGKTSVGARLAQDLGWTFVDVDPLIEADQGTTITEIFARSGEPYFRDLESRILGRVLEAEGQVVSTGGGAVIRDGNRALFRERGVTICLLARPEVVYERIRQETHRPLLQAPDPRARIRELLEERERFYRQADLVIDTSDRTVDEVISEIKRKVRNACG